jgi:hypothetical protein
MSVSFRTADSLAAHAVCAAAGVRDGLRAAQFYARDLANADGALTLEPRAVPVLSRVVAWLARFTDAFMTKGAALLIRLLLPTWRNLPSPFSPGLAHEVATAIGRNSFTHNPLFNAYFFRAANHIIARYCEQPSLVLEHRVDAARRHLAAYSESDADPSRFLARTLIALVKHGAVARVGASHGGLYENTDPNVATFAVACVALMFAAEGRPSEIIDEDEFFEVTAALIGPRLERIGKLIAADDETGLAAELMGIKALY